MISPFRKANVIIDQLESFFSIIEKSTALFESGVNCYLHHDTENFLSILEKIRQEEKKADALLKQIEHALYKYSLLPELRSDIMRLMQRVDDIQDTMKEVLVQFHVETPHIPEDLHRNFRELTSCCMNAALNANTAASKFFRNSDESRPFIELTIEHERQADELAEKLKMKVFHEVEGLDLPQKFHLRYFTLHIENVSDIGKSIAYTLNLMLIKRFEQ